MGEWMSKFMYNGYNSKTIMIHTMLKGETIKSTLENYIVVVLKSSIDYNTCVSTDAFVKRGSEKGITILSQSHTVIYNSQRFNKCLNL